MYDGVPMIAPDCESAPPPAVRMVVTCGSSHRGLFVRSLATLGAPLEHLREAPVDDLHLAEGADHDVRGLEVAMDDAARMGVGDGLAHLLEDREEPAELVGRIGPFFQERRDGSAP